MRVEHIEAESGSYAVHVDGEDPSKPFALFLHGGPGFNSYGERSLLGGRFRAAVNFLWLDQMGCGDSRLRVPEALTWDTQLRDVARVIRHFTPEPAHLVGHSSGAPLIHDLVRLDRRLARSVVLYAATRSLAAGMRRVVRRGVEEGRVPAAAFTAEQWAEVRRFVSLPDEAFGGREALFALQTVGAIRDWHELYWLDRGPMSRWLTWAAERPFAPEVFLRLATEVFERGRTPPPDYAGIPVHMVHSDSDPVAPWEDHGQRWLTLIPHATATLLPGAGHWIHFEKPDECVRSTLEVFARGV